DPPDQREAAVPHLSRDRVLADRRAAVEGLEARRTVGVPEHLRPDLPGLPAGPLADRVQRLPAVDDHRLLLAPCGWEEQGAADSATLLDVPAQDLLELRPERHHS